MKNTPCQSRAVINTQFVSGQFVHFKTRAARQLYQTWALDARHAFVLFIVPIALSGAPGTWMNELRRSQKKNHYSTSLIQVPKLLGKHILWGKILLYIQITFILWSGITGWQTWKEDSPQTKRRKSGNLTLWGWYWQLLMNHGWDVIQLYTSHEDTL